MLHMSIGYRLSLAVLTGALAAALAAPPAGAANMRLGVNGAPLSIEVIGSKEFARLVGVHSKNAVTVEVFDGDKLGKPEAQIENLQLGTQEFHADVSDWLQQLDRDWDTLAMPFLFTGLDHVKKFQKSDTYATMKERLAKEKGIRVVADNWYRLPKVLISSKPVFKPADLQGLKLRMPNLATYIDTWSALGARPTVLAWNESYLAMKTGTVDGMDTPISALYPQKFYQAAPYVLMTDHLVAPYVILMSEKLWQKLPKEQQEAVLKAGVEGGDFYTERCIDDFRTQKQTMLSEGTVFIEANTKPFADKAMEIMQKFEANGKWSPGMVQKIRALAN